MPYRSRYDATSLAGGSGSVSFPAAYFSEISQHDTELTKASLSGSVKSRLASADTLPGSVASQINVQVSISSFKVFRR